jgi:hypothetical protein
MATLLQALLQNESGGRNIPNTTEGTSSGRAEGFFQITTGTWRDFARQAGVDLSQYPNALSAPYDVQARVASVIPLKRWDESTVAKMKATGRPINVNATLGENLAGVGEGFGDFNAKDAKATGGGYTRRHVGGAGSKPENFGYTYTPATGGGGGGGSQYALPQDEKPKKTAGEQLGDALKNLGVDLNADLGMGSAPQVIPGSFSGGEAIPSVMRMPFQPAQAPMASGGQPDLRALLTQLMAAGGGGFGSV